MEIPFDIGWMPDGEWLAHTYYAIDVRHSSLDVHLERTGVFAAGVEVDRDKREFRVLVFKILLYLGFKPDPSKWFKWNSHFRPEEK